MFLLVPAYLGSPGQKAVKRLCVCNSSDYALFVDDFTSQVGTPSTMSFQEILRD